MRRLLMFLYLVLVTSEARPKRGWRRLIRRPQPVSILETGVDKLPTRAGMTTKSSTSPTTQPAPGQPTPEPRHKAVVEVIPKTLVEQEAECAVTLQMPNRTTPQGIRMHGNDRFNCPIGRTLTREMMLKDWRHCPRVAISHLPLDDVSRLVAKGAINAPHPTSPRARGTEKKGRPTPKRPKKKAGDHDHRTDC